MPKLHIYKNEKETYLAFAEWLAKLVNDTLEVQDSFTIALSLGDTPKSLYKILGENYSNRIEWSKVHIFRIDENCTSIEKHNDKSDVNMFADQVPIPRENIHVVNTKVNREEAVTQYENLLHSHFKNKLPTFDLVILGLHEEAHAVTPARDSEENNYTERWIVPVYNERGDLAGIEMTLPAINASIVKAFVVTGKRKEDTVQQVLKGKYDPEKYPAQLVVTAGKSVHWFLDEGAAGKLIRTAS